MVRFGEKAEQCSAFLFALNSLARPSNRLQILFTVPRYFISCRKLSRFLLDLLVRIVPFLQPTKEARPRGLQNFRGVFRNGAITSLVYLCDNGKSIVFNVILLNHFNIKMYSV